jgi:PAS domain S-box-containing protein
MAEKNPICIVFTDKNGTIEYVNEAFSTNTGYSKKELIGGNPRVLNSNYHDKEFYDNLWDTILNGKVWKGVLRNKRKMGEIYWEKAVIAPFKNDKNEITHFIGMKEDITAQVLAQQELEQYKNHLEKLVEERTSELQIAKERVEISEKLKNAFLGSITHEIRTPINGIMGFMSLIENELKDNPHTKEYIEIINSCCNQLVSVMDDIIYVSKIKAGDVALNIDIIDVNEFIQNVFSAYSASVKEKGLKFELKFSKSFNHIFLKTDKTKLKHIFDYLIKNAIKFTNEGCITLGYQIESTHIIFYVKDTGIGISKEIQSLIFDYFRQADYSLSRKYGGIGLGLSISKSLIGYLNGKIWLESELGKGTTFYFSINKN